MTYRYYVCVCVISLLFKSHTSTVCDIFTLVPCEASFVSLPWRDLLPLSVAFFAPWRWHSSPARLLPWRWLQPGPVCRRRQSRSWRREGWCSRSSRPRPKHPLPSQRPLPTGRRAHDESSVCAGGQPGKHEPSLWYRTLHNTEETEAEGDKKGLNY